MQNQSIRACEPRLRLALLQLVDAFSCAVGLGDSVWQFSLRLETLFYLGLSETDLRWLIRSGYADHALETTGRKSPARTFQAVSNLSLGPKSCFILTPAGFRLGQEMATACGAAAVVDKVGPSGGALAMAPRNLVPLWVPERRELRVGKYLVKKYRVPAQNQVTILEAFQEEHWPYRIDNPLAPSPQTDATTRLHEAIARLNRRQKHQLLHFRGDGKGEGVSWEIAG